MPTSSAPELELSLISFAGSGTTTTWQGGDKSKIELARRSVVVLLLFVGMTGRVKRWMSLIAWNLSLNWRPCRFVDMISNSRREFAFINKLRTPNQGIARRRHDRRPLLNLSHKVPYPCFMVREFCFATFNNYSPKARGLFHNINWARGE